MKFDLKVGYVVRKQLREQDPYMKHDRQITEMLIRGATVGKYPQGSSDRTIQDLNGRIKEEIDLAINDERDAVEFERGEIKHILEVTESWSAPSEFHSYVTRLRGSLKKTLEADDAAAKAAKNGGEKPQVETAKA